MVLLFWRNNNTHLNHLTNTAGLLYHSTTFFSSFFCSSWFFLILLHISWEKSTWIASIPWHLYPISIGKRSIGFPGGKELTCQCRRRKRQGLLPWSGRSPGGGAQQLTPVFLPGESQWTEEPGKLQYTRVAKSQAWLKRLSIAQHKRRMVITTLSSGKQLLRVPGHCSGHFPYNSPVRSLVLNLLMRRLRVDICL